MPHVRAWRFRPLEGAEYEFVRAYSRSGRWAELFRRSQGFIKTELLRPEQTGGWWMTLDRWQSAAAFAAFKRDFATEYEALDVELEGVAGEEEFIGAFEAVD